MELIITLAQEHGGETTLWDPTILGILVTIAAAALFIGSIWAIVGTNVGARLGFLVTFTALCGFMMLLSLLWISTASPLNTLRGRIPAWDVLEVVPALDEAPQETVRNIERDGEEADPTQAAEIKAAVDDALVTDQETPTEPVDPEQNEFAEFTEVTDFTTTQTLVVGGSDPNPLKLEFTHTPNFATVKYCAVQEVDLEVGEAPPEPECDPDSDQQGYVVLERNLGSLRVPPTVAFFMFLILFGIGLLALHWREKDEMEAAAQKRPTPVPDATGNGEGEPAGDDGGSEREPEPAGT
ncbi:MAG: hypothetical protein ACRDWD_11405 [Acidimicrobiia bacterium]